MQPAVCMDVTIAHLWEDVLSYRGDDNVCLVQKVIHDVV